MPLDPTTKTNFRLENPLLYGEAKDKETLAENIELSDMIKKFAKRITTLIDK